MSKPDLSDFYALSKPKRPPCQIGLILADEFSPKLDAEQKVQLEAALETDVGIITGAAIVAWLKDRGIDCNATRISNHRRGTCSCG